MAAKISTAAAVSAQRHAVDGCHCRVPQPDFELQRRVWALRGRNHHDGGQIRDQTVPCFRLGVRPQRRLRRAQLLQPCPAQSCRTAVQRLRLQCRRPGSSLEEHPTFFFYNMEWRSLVQGGLTNQTVPLTSEYRCGWCGNWRGDAYDPSQRQLEPHLLFPSLIAVPASIRLANCPGNAAPAGVVPGSTLPQ